MQMPPSPHVAPQGPPPPGIMPGATLSPDGLWRWDGSQWVPTGYAPPGFQPLRVFAAAAQRANFALMGLAVVVVCEIIGIVAEMGRADIASRLLDGSGASVSEATSSDNLVRLSGFLGLGARALAAVAFLMWLYRVVANNHALRRRHLQYTPGWAVGWWFIPFLNIVRPYQVVAETWHATDPGAASSPQLAARSDAPLLVVGWWLVYLAAGIIGVVAATMSGSDATLQSLHDGANVAIVGHVVGVIAAALAMIIVLRVTERQNALHGALEAAPAPA